MQILDAIYHNPDWITSVELDQLLPLKFRTIQNQLRMLSEMDLIIKEEVKPAYRYRVDKTKDLSYYHDYMKVFKMNRTEQINREYEWTMRN